MTLVNSFDQTLALQRLVRDERDPLGLTLENGPGHFELMEILDSIATELNNQQIGLGQFTAAVQALLKLPAVSGFPTLNGYPYATGGSTYAPFAWGGGMPARYAETTMTSEVWAVGAEVPLNEQLHVQYVSIAGDTPGAATYTFRPVVAVRVPDRFTGFSGNAIVFRYTIESVDNYTTGDTVSVKLLIESTVPSFGPLTKTRTETLTAPGPFSDGGVYSTLSVTDLELGDRWQPGALLRVTPYFEVTCAASGVTLDLRWADLRINLE